MRLVSDLLEYVHSYSKYLYIYDLNQQKYIKVNNESINERYILKDQCIYCKVIEDIPKCDADISTRSRFFKHLQDLETKLNKRLVCFENELEQFELENNSDRLKDSPNNVTDSSDTNSTKSTKSTESNKSNYLKIEELIDKFIETTDKQLKKQTNTTNQDLQLVSPSLSDMEISEASDSYDSDQSDQSTDSLDSTIHWSKRNDPGPVIKSIREIEKELNELQLNSDKHKDKKLRKQDYFDYNVVVKQIIRTKKKNEVKFLCYLNEL